MNLQSILIKLVIILSFFLSLFVYGQYNLSNTLGFNYSDNSTKTYAGSLVAVNTYEYGNFSVSDNLSHNISYSGKLTSNEVANKILTSWRKGNNSAFLNLQTNYSLTRNLNVDNLMGIGYGRRDTIIGIKINYSYGILYEKINNRGLEYIRHSFRVKLTQDRPKISWIIEYYYQPMFTGGNNIIVYGTSKLSYKLVNNLSITATDVYNYYSVQKVKTIHQFTLGITYTKTNK